ncbi:MAG: DNA polymerase III subunit gamma and tau, partial [Janibacter sp.]
LEQLCTSEGVAFEPGVLSFVVRAGGGSVRDSLSVLDQLISGSDERGLTYDGAAALLGFTDGELLDRAVTAFGAGDAAGVFTVIDSVIETGLDPRRFVEDLLERFRDLIVVAAAPDGAAGILRGLPTDQVERMRQQAGVFGAASLSRAADIVNAGLTEMTGATSPRVQLEIIAARVLLPAAAGESGYAARLDRLERRLEVGGVPTAEGGVLRRDEGASTGEAPALRQAPPAQQAPSAVSPAEGFEAHPQGGPAPQPRSVEAEPEPESATGFEARPQSGLAPQQASEAPEPEPQAPAPAAQSSHIDVEALRRAWPDVLGRIYQMRRATWTFLSEHAQVISYDGQRLVLGIATTGLANAFRNGSHSEVVRQALIDTIGVDARVEGVPDQQIGQGPSGGGAQATTAPGSGAGPSAPSALSAPSGAAAGGSAPQGPHAGDVGVAAPSTGSGGPDWGSTPADSSSAPAWATAEPASPQEPSGPPSSEEPVEDRGPHHEPDDASVSDDDEDIIEAGAAGPVVIERLLGGTVIREE